jgi:hypothetical protein
LTGEFGSRTLPAGGHEGVEVRRTGIFVTGYCFVENFSLTPGFSRVRKVREEKKTV